MRIGPYILTVVIAVLSCSLSSGPLWLCISASGQVEFKASEESHCGDTGCSDSDDHDDHDDCAEVISLQDDCCLDIPIGLDGKTQLASTLRTGKPISTCFTSDVSIFNPRVTNTPARAATDILSQSHPPGPRCAFMPSQTVVLLI